MLSIPHLIIIFVVALVVFGPEKLPELARNLGKVLGEFRRATGELRNTFEGHLQDLEREAEQRKIGGAAATAAPVAPLSQAATPVIPEGVVATNPPNVPAAAPVPTEAEHSQPEHEEASRGEGAKGEASHGEPIQQEISHENVSDGGTHPA
jgi:sec-independent protein translocase protein TatB